MAEPSIKNSLASPEFTTDVSLDIRNRLTSCLKLDSANIRPKIKGGQNGPHVEAIQKALTKLRSIAPDLALPQIVDPVGVYGTSTSDAVEKYKRANGIQRTGQPLDSIVGRMTITRLDDELINRRARPVPPAPIPPAPVPPEPNILPVAFCKQNRKIILNGTTAVQRDPPMAPADWVASTQSVFDTIYSNKLGQSIIDSVGQETIVKPWLSNETNAQSDGKTYIFFGAWVIEFTALVYAGTQVLPGSRPDEVLLHEFIHMLEGNFGDYKDPPDKSLQWDGADFSTINGVNVYSQMQSRNLRKDHRGKQPMPHRYSGDALEHMIVFRENYERAFDRNSGLFNKFKGATATWNPFSSFERNVSIERYFVEVSGDREWRWLYELFSDSTSRWSDPNNIAEYGIGKWRKEGSLLIVDWKGGSFDRFSEVSLSSTVIGRNKTAGVERDSKVTRPPAQPRAA